MITKSVAISCILVVAYAATIQQRTIPVEIRYDEGVQITPKELRAIAEEVVKEELVENAVKNLDAKVQLSPAELTESLKHLPVPEGPFPEDNSIEKSDEKPVAANQQLEAVPEVIFLKKADEVPQKDAEEIPQEKPEAQENADVPEAIRTKASTISLEVKLQHLRDVVVTELRTLRDSFKPKNGQLVPNPEQWAELEKSVSRVYEEAKNKLLAKQTQLPEPTVGASTSAPAPAQEGGNIFQNFINGVNGLMQNFVQNIQQGGTRPPSTQGDEGTPGSSNQGGFIGYFQQGISNIMNIITNGGQNQGGPSTTSTVLGDTGSASPAQPPASGNPVSTFFGGVVTNVQQIFGIQGGSSTAAPGTQGDTGVNPPATSNQQGPGAQFVQAIGNTINSIFQGGARPPATSGDEGTPAAGSGGPQNIFASFSNAIQNSPLNIFRPQNGGAGTQNPVQTGIQSAGNQIQQAVSGIQGQFVSPAASSSEGGLSSVTPVVETTDGQRKPTTENTVQTNKPEKVENDNEIVQKVDQKEEILTTAE